MQVDERIPSVDPPVSQKCLFPWRWTGQSLLLLQLNFAVLKNIDARLLIDHRHRGVTGSSCSVSILDEEVGGC